MRMVEGLLGAHAHEFLDADVDRRVAGIVLEVGDGSACHEELPGLPPPPAASAAFGTEAAALQDM
jgi:hypothetical protein